MERQGISEVAAVIAVFALVAGTQFLRAQESGPLSSSQTETFVAINTKAQLEVRRISDGATVRTLNRGLPVFRRTIVRDTGGELLRLTPGTLDCQTDLLTTDDPPLKRASIPLGEIFNVEARGDGSYIASGRDCAGLAGIFLVRPAERGKYVTQHVAGVRGSPYSLSPSRDGSSVAFLEEEGNATSVNVATVAFDGPPRRLTIQQGCLPTAVAFLGDARRVVVAETCPDSADARDRLVSVDRDSGAISNLASLPQTVVRAMTAPTDDAILLLAAAPAGGSQPASHSLWIFDGSRVQKIPTSPVVAATW